MPIVRKSSYHRLKENNNRKKRALSEREKEVETLQEETANLSEELAKFKGGDAGADLTVVVSEKDAKIQALQDQLSASQKEVSLLKSDTTSSQMLAQVKEVKQQRDAALQQLDEKVAHYEAHVKSLEKNSANRKEQLVEAAGQIDALKNTQQMLEHQLYASVSSREELENAVKDETTKREAIVSKLNEEIAALKAALTQGGGQLPVANTDEVNTVKMENLALQEKLAAAHQELKDTSGKVEEMRSDNEQLASAVSSYHEKYRRLLAKVNNDDGKDAPQPQQTPEAAAEVTPPTVEEPTKNEEPSPAVVEEASSKEQATTEEAPIDMEQHGLDDLAEIVKEKVQTTE